MPIQDSVNSDDRNLNAALGAAAAALVVVLSVIFAIMHFIVWPNQIMSEGAKRQADVTKAYSIAVGELDRCVVTTQGAAKVAAAQADTYKSVVQLAVAGTGFNGKYDLNTDRGRSAFRDVFVQAWPDTKGVEAAYAKVTDTLIGCQSDFRGAQAEAIRRAEDLNSWPGASWKSRTYGADKFPNDRLSVNVAGVTATGVGALDIMRRPIVTSLTAGAVGSGELEADDYLGDSLSPAATPSPSSSS